VKMINALLLALVVLALLAALTAGMAFAQSTNAIVSGLVVDPNGRAIAGADMEIVNDATGVRYPGTTNNEGIYQIPNLPPGLYRLQVSKQGFKTLLKPDIVLRTEDALAINFTLPVGATIETVTVESGGSGVNTGSASVSTVIDRQFVQNLPLNGRSFNTLLQLTPGVVIAQQPTGTGSGVAPGQFSISGQRTDANTFTVDGVSANFGVATNGLYSGQSGTGTDQAFSALGGTSSLVSVEALEEFRVETSSFAPEFGKTPGGQVMLTTRSGTNELHGGVYEYFRNDVMDANDWFANQAGQPRAAERHNNFGGFLGGRILPNRTFFFFSYEGARLRLPRTSVTDVPYLNDTTCVAPPAVAPLLNAFPKPNSLESSTTCTGQFTGTYSNSATLDATSLRIDHRLNSRFSLFGRYNFAPSSTTTRQYALNILANQPVNTQTGTAGLNMQLSRYAANTLRANFSTQSSGGVNSLDSFGGGTVPDASIILGSLPPEKNLGTFETLDTDEYSTGPLANNRARQIDIVDTLNLSVAAHGLQFGADYRTIYLDKVPYDAGVGMIARTVQGLITSGALTEVVFAHAAPTHFVTDSTSLYAQDNWKATPRLTVIYGLRWEIAPAPSPHDGTLAASWLNVGDPAAIALAPWGTPLWTTTWSNIAPRLGISWQPSSRGDLVLRGGAGLFYDLGVGRAADVSTFFPGTVNSVILNVPLPYTAQSSDLPPFSLSPPYPLVSAFSQDLRLPRSWEWNLAAEKAFRGHQVLTATYVGQDGIRLLRQQADYKPNPDFSSAFLLTDNSARSDYNALQLQYRVSLSSSLQALLNYTYGHSLDNSSNDIVAGPSDSVIPGAGDYASSDFDVRQSFSGALTATLPTAHGTKMLRALSEGWSVAGVAVARSGFPFNAKDLGLSAVTGGYIYTRPDRVPGQPVWIQDSQAGGGKSLNPSAFSIPTIVRQGTEGRNDIQGFGLAQVDISLARTFPIVENWRLKFQADAFNVANHPNFASPIGIVGLSSTYLHSTEMLNDALGGLNPLFQEGGPRSLQLSLKLSF
jgi:Carboxypeptidase regulatory-like domain/TonB dependent receptor